MNLSIEKLIPYRNQAREIFDEEGIADMANTIKLYGIRQPLTVIPNDHGQYEVVSGERRLMAAKIANLMRVPCIVLDNIEHADEIALIENLQRQDLHPIEFLNGINQLIKNGRAISHEELSKKLGVSRTKITEILLLDSLSEEVKKILLEKNVRSRATLRALIKVSQELQVIKLQELIYKSENKREKINKQSKILEIVMRGEKFELIVNKIKLLDPNKKEELKKIFLDSFN